MPIFFFKDFGFAAEFVLKSGLAPLVGSTMYFSSVMGEPLKPYLVKDVRYEVYKMGIATDAMTSGRIAVLIEDVA